MSLSSGSKMSGPLVATTGVIRPNTPNGAMVMIMCMILMHTSDIPLTKSATGCAFLPAARMPKPKNSAITMICSMLASDMGCTKLLGKMLTMVSMKEGAALASYESSSAVRV